MDIFITADVAVFHRLIITCFTDMADVFSECAKFLYNHLGCALMEDAFGKDGTVYSLIASPMEIIVESYCKEVSTYPGTNDDSTELMT